MRLTESDIERLEGLSDICLGASQSLSHMTEIYQLELASDHPQHLPSVSYTLLQLLEATSLAASLLLDELSTLSETSSGNA